MIIENEWLPVTVNKRTVRWAKRCYKPPVWELVWFTLPLIMLVAISMYSAFVSDVIIPPIVMPPSVAIFAYMFYETRYPVQKYIGVPFDGVRMNKLREHITEAWSVLANNPVTHVLVDGYLRRTEKDAIDIAVYEQWPTFHMSKPGFSYCRLSDIADVTSIQIALALESRKLVRSKPKK